MFAFELNSSIQARDSSLFDSYIVAEFNMTCIYGVFVQKFINTDLVKKARSLYMTIHTCTFDETQ